MAGNAEGGLMTQEEKNVVVSENYREIIIDLRSDPNILQQFQNSPVNIINEYFAVVYFPAEQFSEIDLMKKYTYREIPKLY
jgi:hypothetical protein